MRSGQPSRTALAAASHRAAHQVLEQGRIFSDPLALRILGANAATVAHDAEEHPSRRRLRVFIAARHRFAEDALAIAIAQGVRQVVVLGAGLDTWAYRRPVDNGAKNDLRVFEVDHPATQAWKRERLADAGIAVPESLTFAPVDFERDTLDDGLAAAGFNRGQATFFTWLGVVPYLATEAVWSTLGFIASLPKGTQVVFDYANPPDTLSGEQRATHELRAARVAELGEEWLTFFDSDALAAKLSEIGFRQIEDLGPPQIAARYFPGRAAAMPEKGGHVLHASTS